MKTHTPAGMDDEDAQVALTLRGARRQHHRDARLHLAELLASAPQPGTTGGIDIDSVPLPPNRDRLVREIRVRINGSGVPGA